MEYEEELKLLDNLIEISINTKKSYKIDLIQYLFFLDKIKANNLQFTETELIVLYIKYLAKTYKFSSITRKITGIKKYYKIKKININTYIIKDILKQIIKKSIKNTINKKNYTIPANLEKIKLFATQLKEENTSFGLSLSTVLYIMIYTGCRVSEALKCTKETLIFKSNKKLKFKLFNKLKENKIIEITNYQVIEVIKKFLDLKSSYVSKQGYKLTSCQVNRELKKVNSKYSSNSIRAGVIIKLANTYNINEISNLIGEQPITINHYIKKIKKNNNIENMQNIL